MVVIAVALLIVVAAPEYAKPAAGAALVAESSTEPSPGASGAPLAVAPEIPLSPMPDQLKGYRWPVAGGMVHAYYERDPKGQFVIDGKPVHAGLVITWSENAPVKAAHKGKVIYAGREWAEHIGYNDSLEEIYKRLDRKKQKPGQGVVIDDGNGYLSVYSEIQDLRVKTGDKVKRGQIIGGMSRAEGLQMMRYQLVRSDGLWMKVADAYRERDYPTYIRELVDPLAVLDLDGKRKPNTTKRKPPKNPPRLSDYPSRSRQPAAATP